MSAYDPYRDALVVEEVTHWPFDLGEVPESERPFLERILHQQPAQAASLEYVRLYSGFARHITVTQVDLTRIRQSN